MKKRNDSLVKDKIQNIKLLKKELLKIDKN